MRSAPGLMAVDRVFDPKSGIKNVFAQVRPCGHHAERERAMGFCIFANVGHRRPLRAQEIRRGAHRRRRLRRAPRQRHAGHVLERQGPVLRLHAPDAAVSRHRRAERDGRRQHLECAAAARATAATRSRKRSNRASCRRLRSFSPDIVLISAGFDAHRDDPLANLQLTEPDFGWATAKIAEVADKHAQGGWYRCWKEATTSPRWRGRSLCTSTC